MTCHRTFICILDCLTADFRSSYDTRLHHGLGNGSRRWLERSGFISRPYLILMMLAVGMVTLHAAPDPPVEVIINPYTLLFSGNQSAGIKDELNNIARVLEVRNLTSTIQPASGEFGILWRSNSGADMTLNSGGIWTESGGFVLGQQVSIITTGLDATHWGGGIYVAAEANGSVTINSNSAITTHGISEISGVYAHGIYALGQGVQGSNGSNAGAFGDSSRGDPGATGGNVTIDARGNVDTRDSQSIGIFALSAGGLGGNGGDGGTFHDGSRGGDGGAGGKVVVKGDAVIVTNGAQSFGILAVSAGGDAGPGGSGHVFTGGGQGADGGVGGEVLVNGTWNITTHGDDSHGIWAKSNGGSGSDGGGSGFIAGSSGSGGVGTPGGTVNVTSGGQIITDGIRAYGIFAESIGGFGGGGGSSGVFVSSSGDGSSGGAGGAVTVVTLAGSSIETNGAGSSHGILAQSVGGGGGTGAGAAALFSANGGDGAPGGNGGSVLVRNAGKITTAKTGARGIYAQSIGGGGGDGGDAVGISSIGGSGGNVFLSSGGEVIVANTGDIRTQSNAIFAQSVGGGGGNGGSSSGWISLGGKGSGGGNGGMVVASSTGNLQTFEDNATALFAQSLGGGGGNGGSSVAVGAFEAVAIGGSGSGGGKGGNVWVGVNPSSGFPDPVTGNTISTKGAFSNGIQAQSIGGGGGNGGYATSASVGLGASASIALGGSAGDGGSAGNVEVYYGDANSKILTEGNNSNGIFAQSVGGGGGSGGMSISAAASDAYSVSLSMGGAGGSGGIGGNVLVGNAENPLLGGIETQGEHSYGILAQSIGGGGGNGGMSIAGSLSGTGGAALSFGGNGGAGNTGGNVSVFSHNSITTKGANSHGVFAQSVGGGGGSGGSSIAGSLTGNAAIDLSFGGKGGFGGTAGTVSVVTGEEQVDFGAPLSSLKITTEGWRSYGVLAQSIGGGGGDGGYSIGGSISGGPTITVAIGGGAAGGGDARKVDLLNYWEISTIGDDSVGLLAQSLGGNGGNGGFSVDGSINTSGAVTMGVGGNGGNGGIGADVSLTNKGRISTSGKNADGILAQSIGGGGGNGGFSVGLSLSTSTAGNFSIGGKGAAGGTGGNVTLKNYAIIETRQSYSNGMSAQSIGGGGGNGGLTVGGSFTAGGALNLSIGGAGRFGSSGGNVELTNYGAYIMTLGPRSFGVLAQSIGGGGGNGGFSVGASSGLGVDATSLAASVGGDGGLGGNAGAVRVKNNGTIISLGDNSSAIVAQSIGGGGGNGGFSFAGSVGGTPGHTLTASVGGKGGAGGVGGTVDVIGTIYSPGGITTYGAQSHGILAQSIGGGGGNGGFSASLSSGTGGAGGSTTSVSVSVGGGAGSGNVGGAVNIGTSSLSFTGNIETNGAESTGIFAQSIGGGGGNGGFSMSGAFNLSTADDGANKAVSISVGGGGGTGNNAGTVGVYHAGTIQTKGDGSHGIQAQSIGGGGGNGGSARGFTLTVGAADPGDRNRSLALSIGGNGSGGGAGGAVNVNNIGDVTTQGGDAYGIFAQSIGGGGGSGGDAHIGIPNITLPPNLDRTKSPKTIELGGKGGSSGDGGEIVISQQGNVKTTGDGSYGVFAQSIGGGGGAGGNGVEKSTIALGGGSGSTGNGGSISISTVGAGNIGTLGMGAHGIFAQSIGGGGGAAGGTGDSTDSSVKSRITHYADVADVGTGAFDNIGKILAPAGGNGGSGGNVTISSTSVITTAGPDAAGIFAQSVGGGGGVAGSLGAKGLNFAGSVGGAGSAGTVDIFQSGNVTTNGARSDGIFAQSAGGAGGSGGLVKVRVEADILANGEDSNGIFAQSSGGDHGGDIAVTIVSVMIQGGLGNGAAIRFVDGKDNTLENSGFIMSLAGPSGISISGGSGNETVNNYGEIKGSMDLGGGTNAINNQSGGQLQSGDFIVLGEGNTLYNGGIISPGGDFAIQSTKLTGNLVQADGAYAFWRFDIGSSGKADLFAISGTARLGSSFNQVDISLMGLPASVGTYTLITASSGLTGTFALGSLKEPAMPSGLTFGLVNTPAEEQLTLSASVGNFYWRGANGTNWNTAFNSGSSVWSSNVDGTFIFGTPGAGSDVFFAATNALSATYATVLGADFAVNSLTFLSSDPMSIGGGNTLTIVAAKGTGISINPGSGPVTISANMTLGGSQTWINNSSSLFSVTSPSIAGSGNNLTIDGSGDTQISAAIQTGSGGVNKTGSGTLTLSGTNTFTGPATVSNGTLLVNGSLGNSAVTVQSSATLGGNGTIDGDVSVLSGGSLSAGNSPGTLTVGSLSLGAGSNLNFELGVPGEVGQEYPPGNDLVNVTGTLVLAGTVNVTQLANFGAGSYRLFNFGSLINNGVTVNITPGASNLAAQVVTGVTGQVNLLVLNATLIGSTQFWDGAHTDNSTIEGGSWSWDNFNHNWTNEAGVNNVAWQNGVAYFGGQAGTITLVDTVNPQGLVFATSGYVINGSEGFTLNLVGPTPAPTITVSSNMVATINANITGSNGLTVDGTGTLILTGANTYTGGTMITAGKLVLGDGATSSASLGPDSVTVTSGTFVLNLAGAEVFGNKVTDNSHMLLDGTQGNDYTLSGSLSGSGDMTKEGGNNVTLSGTNTFSGAVTVNSGTLSLQNGAAVADTVAVRVNTPGTLSLLDSETVGSLEGDGVVALNAKTLTTGGNDSTTTFSGSISGTGGNLVKQGAGTLTLGGTNTYTGTTDVNVGVLVVSGSLNGAGDVTVASKAVLTGEGSVTTAVNHSVFLNGTLNVQSVGSGAPTTFSVTTSGTGALVLGAGSVIAVDLFTGAGLYDNTAVAGASDVLSLTGNLNATGGGTLVIGNPKAMTGFVSGDKWQLVNLNNGAGSITGTLALNDSSLHLSATQAGSFDEATGVYTVVDTRSGLQMAALQGHAVLSTIQNALGDVNGRLFMLRAGGGEEVNDGSIASSLDEGVTLGFGDGPEDTPVARKVLRTRQWEVFTTVNYANISLSGIGTQAGVDAQTWSPSVGIERHLTSSLTLGFAMSYINTHQSYASSLGHLDIQGIALSAYGSYVRGPFWIDILYSFGALDLDSVRNPGAGLATAHGDTGSTTNSVQFNTGWNFRFQNNTFVTGPLVGVDYTHVAVSGYTESTGGIAAMAYGRRDFDSLISRIGWSASKMFVTNCGTITPQLRLSYERQNITNNNATSASLVNLPLTATTRSEAPGQDYLLLGTGINFAFGDRFRLLLSYQVQLFRQDIQAHSGAIRFSYSF